MFRNQITMSPAIYSVQCYFFLILFSLTIISVGPAEPRMNVNAGVETVSGSGEIKFASGTGFQIAISIPYARNLELFGSYIFPVGMDVENGNVEGQIFSAGSYTRSYKSLKFQSLSAGFGLLGFFRDSQRLVPFLNMRFGKSWIYGSSKDGFSGGNIDIGGGLRYMVMDNVNIELSYNICNITFNTVEINNDKHRIYTNVEETIKRINLIIIYTIRFTKNRETA